MTYRKLLPGLFMVGLGMICHFVSETIFNARANEVVANLVSELTAAGTPALQIEATRHSLLSLKANISSFVLSSLMSAVFVTWGIFACSYSKSVGKRLN